MKLDVSILFLQMRGNWGIQAKFRDLLGMDIAGNVSVKWLIFNGNTYISGKSLIITQDKKIIYLYLDW